LTDSFIQVSGTNKNLETLEFTNSNGDTVHREGVFIGDGNSGDKVSVINFIPGPSEVGIVTRPIVPISQFGELITTERTPIIELNSSYGTSLLRDVIETTNSGSVTSSSGEIKISTGATANSKAHFDSAEAGRCTPGYGAEIKVGFRVPTLPTGNQYAQWGGHDVTENNGIFFGVDATGLYTAINKGGTVTKTYQSSWNIDQLDGTGPSGITADLSKGNIWRIIYTWCGQIVWGKVATINNQQQFVPCHYVVPEGSPSIESPNLYIFTEVLNGGDAVNFDAYVGGRQYSIVGRYRPKFRYTSDLRTGVSTSTSILPIVSFRNKTAFLDRSVRVAGMEVKPTTEDVIVELRINCTLTNASWQTPTNHTAAETAVESDISATALTNGIVVWSEIFEAGKKNDNNTLTGEALDIDLPQQQPVTLCVRTLSGTGTVTANFRVQEEW